VHSLTRPRNFCLGKLAKVGRAFNSCGCLTSLMVLSSHCCFFPLRPVFCPGFPPISRSYATLLFAISIAAGVYPPSTILRSTALNLSVEYKKHFRNGSIDLANKVTTACTFGAGGISPQHSANAHFFFLFSLFYFFLFIRFGFSRRKAIYL